MCARGKMHDEDTRNTCKKMHAPNECAKSHRERQAPAASPPARNAAQSACTGIHSPHPAPHPPPMQSVHRCKSKESAWAQSRRHGRGRCWDLGEGKLGCSRGREPGPGGEGSAQGLGAPTFRMRRFRRASAANTRSPTAESSMLTRRFPPWPLPGAEKQQPAHDRP